jgi:hypothetical protein
LARVSAFFRAALLTGFFALASFFARTSILFPIGFGLFAEAFLWAFFKAFFTARSLALMATFLSGEAFLSAFLRAATFLANLIAFLSAALLTGWTAFLRAF